MVGSKDLGAIARFFLGSALNKLANNSLCSVLIMK
ncbi:MAG: universal stress protein [Nitrosopumilus sp.]|nr:universal stress protein [Nitrosopumilus sp.]MDH3516849.1 universal stress protein [Nitrosopumilus sp.]MDH3565199.1 universal stress protein [Nitrosopumilus sp.]MDH5417592.1 universal stress protein [Nitrosopumilus sp.]MDH5555289.1 universal stress protein [Nitrosopumilus sp.]